MPVLELPIQVGTVPEGFCNTLGPDWIQQVWNLFGQSVALLGTGSTSGTIILYQESVPGIDQRNFLWFRPSTGRIFYNDGGAWISPNPIPAAGIERQWVEGTPSQIWSMDGGDGTDPATAPGPQSMSGAMWEIDTNYAGRSPMGVGAIPNSFPAKTLSLSENYGEGAHTAVLTEMVPHSHGPGDGADGILGHADGSVPASFNVTAGGDTISLPTTGSTGGNSSGTSDPFNVTHPIRAGYMVKRTARIYYIAAIN